MQKPAKKIEPGERQLLRGPETCLSQFVCRKAATDRGHFYSWVRQALISAVKVEFCDSSFEYADANLRRARDRQEKYSALRKLFPVIMPRQHRDRIAG